MLSYSWDDYRLTLLFNTFEFLLCVEKLEFQNNDRLVFISEQTHGSVSPCTMWLPLDAAERNVIIKVYFEMGLVYSDILRALAQYHQTVISIRHLKRILKGMGLSRRKDYSNIADVISFVEHQLNESGKQHGYRWMAQKCKVSGLKSTQEEVRIILRMLDPEGTQQRKGRRLLRRAYISKGPNFLWHFDSYDKLKRFGFCINGCVDGFSRYNFG